jgi:hypothetical protein
MKEPSNMEAVLRCLEKGFLNGEETFLFRVLLVCLKTYGIELTKDQKGRLENLLEIINCQDGCQQKLKELLIMINGKPQ